MTTCDRCSERIDDREGWKTGAFGYTTLCLSCYADLKDWGEATLGDSGS